MNNRKKRLACYRREFRGGTIIQGTTIALASAFALTLTRPAWAGDAEAIAGCGVCSSILLIPVVLIALNIALLVWVARDAKARGMDSAILWMLLVMFTSVIGLVIYLFSRPQGEVVPCSNCRNRRLQVSVRCPHCGVA